MPSPAAAASVWLLLTPHGTGLFIAILASLVCLGIYFASEQQ